MHVGFAQSRHLLQVSGIGGMIVGLATAFKPTWAPWSAPLYAALKGAVLGALSIQVLCLGTSFENLSQHNTAW